MNFAGIIARVDRGIRRTDLAEDYPNYVNEALREIQNRRSWTFMKGKELFVIPALGAGQVVTQGMVNQANPQEATIGPIVNGSVVPALFKELQKTRPVHYVTDDGQLLPADVVTEPQQVYRIWAFGGTPMMTWPPRVYYERRQTGAVLGVLEPLSQPFTLQVAFYGFLAPLVNDTDTSPFIDNWPEMVLAKAKSQAFADINDAEGVSAMEGLFEAKLRIAMAADAYSETRGLQPFIG